MREKIFIQIVPEDWLLLIIFLLSAKSPDLMYVLTGKLKMLNFDQN